MNAAALNLALVMASIAASGCSSVDAFNKASNAYSAVRTGMTAKAAYSSVKDLKDALPVFQGYTSVSELAEVTPRESNTGFPETFRQNMLYLVAESARASGAALTTCQTAAGCAGRVLVIQFREAAYDGGLIERVTMGRNSKGRCPTSTWGRARSSPRKPSRASTTTPA